MYVTAFNYWVLNKLEFYLIKSVNVFFFFNNNNNKSGKLEKPPNFWTKLRRTYIVIKLHWKILRCISFSSDTEAYNPVQGYTLKPPATKFSFGSLQRRPKQENRHEKSLAPRILVKIPTDTSVRQISRMAQPLFNNFLCLSARQTPL